MQVTRVDHFLPNLTIFELINEWHHEVTAKIKNALMNLLIVRIDCQIRQTDGFHNAKRTQFTLHLT